MTKSNVNNVFPVMFIGAATARVARGSRPYQILKIQHGTRPIVCSKVLIHYYLDPTQGGICGEEQWGIYIKIEEKLRKN